MFELAARLLARARELAPDEGEFKGPMPLIEDFRAFQVQQQIAILEFRPPEPLPSANGVPNRIRVGANVMDAKLVFKQAPVYPDAARDARIQGMVQFTATIGRDGTVKNLLLRSGHPLLVPAAVEAARQYRYQDR